jgi:hypothetical protein
MGDFCNIQSQRASSDLRSLQYSRELKIQYIRNFLTSRLHRIQRTEKKMHSFSLLSFIYPRQIRASAEVPVIVILHFSNSFSFPSIQALLGHGTVGITATCTPVDFGEGKPCLITSPSSMQSDQSTFHVNFHLNPCFDMPGSFGTV